MKRIKYISPIEEMSGNLSGAQNLKYPTKDNKAYESPEGSVNYARNYKNRFIGAVRRKDGMCYFSVKTKTATHITRKSLQAMAVLGGAGSIYSTIVRDKSGQLYTQLQFHYVKLQEYGLTDSFRKWLTGHLTTMLRNKEQSHTIAGPAGSLTIYTPWLATISDVPNDGNGVPESWKLPVITDFIRVKFWEQLGPVGAFTKIATTADGQELKMLLVAGTTFANQKQLGLYAGAALAGQLSVSNGNYVRAIIGNDLNASNYLYAKSAEDETPAAVEVSATPSSTDIYSFSTTAPN